MASSYSTNLKIELQATGENSGTWGTITNTNLGTALEQAVVGYGNPSYPSDANLTLTYTDTNAAQAARALVLNVTSAVSLTVTRELVVPTIQKQYIVQNNTTGSQSITVKTSAGTGITVPNGRKAHLYVDGTNVILMDDFVDINGGAIDGTTIGASSAAAGTFTTLGATTGNITTVNATTVDTTNIEVTNLKAKDGTAAGSIADSTGVVTLGSSVLTTTDINGGTIDGTVIGGAAAAAGTFTTATATTGNITTVNATTVDTTNIEVTNLKAKDGTAAGSIADSTGVVTLASSVLTTTDINGGTIDGTTIGGSSAAAGTFTTLTTSSTVTLNGGTANGVLFLNASKVATSGSALTFDGSTFGITSSAVSTGNINSTNANGSAFIFQNSGTSVGWVGNGSSSFVGASASNFGINGQTNLLFGVSGFEKARIDASGNLGLGVTPSAWGVDACLEIEGGKAISFASNTGYFNTNAYFNSGWKYITSSTAAQYQQDAGSHKWYAAASGTAGNAITFTEIMRAAGDGFLFTNGAASHCTFDVNLGISAASWNYGYIRLGQNNLFCLTWGGAAAGYGDTVTLKNPTNNPMVFGTNNTERARFTAAGSLLINRTAIDVNTASFIQVTSTANSYSFLSAASGGTTGYVGLFLNSSGTTVGSITTDASSTTYSTSSDVRLKKNIVNAHDSGADVDALQVRSFDWKTDDSHVKYGFIAQELVTVAPKAVFVGDADDVEDFKNPWGVDYSKLVPMLVKELQSLRKRVAELEAK